MITYQIRSFLYTILSSRIKFRPRQVLLNDYVTSRQLYNHRCYGTSTSDIGLQACSKLWHPQYFFMHLSVMLLRIVLIFATYTTEVHNLVHLTESREYLCYLYYFKKIKIYLCNLSILYMIQSRSYSLTAIQL